MATILLPALDDPDALDVLVSIHDVTESMRVQEELDVAKKEVEANLETIKRDIAFGESVQRAILPPAFPVGSRYDIDGFMQAARTVGGDFYDFYVLDDDTIGFAIADVSGKGVPADLYLTVRLACHVEELSQREAARRFGYQDLFHIGLEGSPMHRPVEEHRGRQAPERRKPAVNVVVFQWPWGMAARHRSPLRDHPRSRAIFIDAPVWSMKISRSGASPAWPSNQSRRRASTSGRRCSAAWPVFFCASARAWRRSARPSTGTPEPRATPPASRQSRPAS